MKKIIIVIASVTVLCMIFCACSVYYSESAQYEGFDVHINRKENCCFVGKYTASGENEEITVPDEYDGVPITSLGGYYGRGMPTPFYIDLKDAFYSVPPSDSDHRITGKDSLGSEEIQDIVFTLNIGKNIKELKKINSAYFYPNVDENGDVCYYHAVVYVNCSEDNPVFYSEDGRLFSRETNDLVTSFDYSK